MSDFDRSTGIPSDDALEQLLKHASPRPTPSRSDEAAVRQAVRAEWQNLTQKRQSRRRVLNYAVAATVLVGVFAVFNTFRTPTLEAVPVATIQKSFGSVYLLGEKSELRETVDLSVVSTGQTIVTGRATGLALAWGNGGSLRVDEGTRIQFISDDAVYLESGQIYFDSESSSLIAGAAADRVGDFSVITEYGEVAHIGTQFMTGVDTDRLTVSVREGRVTVDSIYHDYVATPGEQVTFSGRQRPSVLSISPSGDSWDWVSRTSPAIDVEGRTFHDLLEWVSRETGLAIEYEGRAEQVARQEAILKGTIDKEPLEALRSWSRTSALKSRIVEGVIIVSDNL